MKSFYAYASAFLLIVFFFASECGWSQHATGSARYSNGIPATIAGELVGAYNNLETNPAEALQQAREALHLAQASRDMNAASLARELMGKACEGLNDPVGAVINYGLQIELAQTAASIVEGRLNQAAVYTKERNYDSALVVLRDAERRCPANSSTGQAGDIQFMLGKVHYDQSDYKTSEKHYSKAALDYRRVGNKQRLADTYLRMANCRNFLGDYESALNLYLSSLDTFTALGDAKGASKAQGNMAGIYIAIGEYPKAIEQYKLMAQNAVSSGDKRSLAIAHQGLGVTYIQMEDNNRAIEELLTALRLADELNYTRLKAFLYMSLGNIFGSLRQYDKSMEYYRQEQKLRTELQDDYGLAYTLYNIAITQNSLGDTAAAVKYHRRSLEISERIQDPEAMSLNLTALSTFLLAQGKPDDALAYSRRAWNLAYASGAVAQLAFAHDNVGTLFFKMGVNDSALYHYREMLRIGKELNSYSIMKIASSSLSKVYKKMNALDSAYSFAELHAEMQDSVYRQDKNREVVSAEARYQAEKKAQEIALLTKEKQLTELRVLAAQDSLRDVKQENDLAMLQAQRARLENEAKQRELDYVSNLRLLDNRRSDEALARAKADQKLAETEASQSQTLTVVISGGLLLVLVAAIVAFVGYRGRKRAHDRLQATQEQLLVQEKLASLGQLTAGIAHEIQNPLNFVNNFSDMTRELAIEAQEEIIENQDMPVDEKFSELTMLLMDIRNNSERVSGHGKRASAIVNQMLQHARTETGEVSDIDLNKMLGEMTDLAYHGMRAQHKGIVINVERDFSDDGLIVNAGAQELGRVVVNILNNAFDALIELHERKPEHSPEVVISTYRHGGNAEVRIRDNGPGIPAAIRDKIFQPFYTTKPSGKGTGLGLSLSYDIITKKYGGKLGVDSVPGEYTEFSISLPLKKS